MVRIYFGDVLGHYGFGENYPFCPARRILLCSNAGCGIADEFCLGVIIAVGEGGYKRTNLPLVRNAVIDTMLK